MRDTKVWFESRNFSPWRDGVLPVLRGRAFVIGGLLVLSLLSCATACHAQQVQPPQARGTTIPTLEALPHDPLPRGDFIDWCGLNDRALLGADKMLEAVGGGVKSSTLFVPRSAQVRCSDDGQRLVFVDDDAGSVSEVDVPSGAVTRTLATYEKQLFHPKISFSPDLKNVASDRPLTLVSSAVNLKTIQLKGRNVLHIRWSPDSSEFFVISGRTGKTRPDIVEIFNAHNQKIGSGNVPAQFLFRDGWFANSQVLYLYLGSIDDEFGSGVILRCNIENWKCDQTARNVLGASVGGDGVLGMVRAVGKYSNDGETETYPPRYAAEIRKGASQVVARQTFKSAERNTLSLAVAPSGTKAILTWFGKAGPGCPPKKQESGSCKDGMMIDLAGRLK
jgi:hypothetical protein